MDSINLSELFLDDNYSIDSLLAKTQEGNLNLNELRNKLIQHQQDLNQTSLDLFNNSYDRFYKLSYIISCLAEPIQHLIDPLQNFRDQLHQLCQNHDNYVQNINNKLTSLEETCKNKELAKKLILLIKKRDRIESQMENIDWSVRPINCLSLENATNKSQEPRDIEYVVKCDLLERIHIELYHLICEVRAIKPTHDELIPIKKSLESALDNRLSQFDNWFEGAFLEAIEWQDKAFINLILTSYTQRNAIYRLDHIWRNKVVKPYLNLTLTETQLTQQIGQTYELLRQFLKRQLDVIQAPFVVKSFWEEVVDSLDKLKKIYSLQELETFQSRYIQTRSFLMNQNDYSLSESLKIGLTKKEINGNFKKIMEKFNLKGYFNHRLSQIASSVESSLSTSPLSELSQTNFNNDADPSREILLQFRLKICMHIYALVTKCWSPELYIDSLELNFSQLACRIINRFAEWLSKLRLSDFRITGFAAPETNKPTNFLAKQDAIMRVLIEDCDRLIKLVSEFLTGLTHHDTNLIAIRRELITDSFNTLNNGLSNVRSLQKLIER